MLARSLPATSYPVPFIASSLLRVAQEVVARTADVSLADLQAPTRRSARTARARQQAMYLAHTVLGLSISAIGRECHRHHSTVAHACSVVEEQRDDPAVDRALAALEKELSARCGGLSS